jgi:hypothetical protein
MEKQINIIHWTDGTNTTILGGSDEMQIVHWTD